jgi:hypothetical protein
MLVSRLSVKVVLFGWQRVALLSLTRFLVWVILLEKNGALGLRLTRFVV